MITFFSTPKPFRGHIGIIQRNAIHSWKLVHPDAEVILFGNEEGAAEVSRELGARHEPEVDRNSHGTPLISSLFDRADRLARHGRLCFLNADILLTGDFLAATTRLAQMQERSLMVGRRLDVDITEPLDFSKPDWGERLRSMARERGKLRPPQWIDYFVFPRGLLYQQVPPFVIGRTSYDNWLLWKVRSMRVPVVDATQVVLAIHQNHDYSFHPGGQEGLWQDVEAKQNQALLGKGHFATIDNATHRLTPNGLRPNYYHWVAQAKRKAIGVRNAAWFGLLDLTRPVRRWLGQRQRHSPDAPR
ncbi:MAG TPA: hypothetical protein VN976_20110 [Verrucomicrobiae bacterium]|nr:hypothetical protein [Verrucomicrobiae bacterium]